MEPARWELYEDNIACIYIESQAQKLTHLNRNERLLLRKLGHIWYDSLWRYHGIARDKVKSLERETVSLDPLPDEKEAAEGGKEGEKKEKPEEEGEGEGEEKKDTDKEKEKEE